MALPYTLLPTEQLRYTGNTDETVSPSKHSSKRQTQLTKQPRRARPLSAEDSASIYSYIRAHNKNGLVRWPKARKEAEEAPEEALGGESADGQFYLPALSTVGGQTATQTQQQPTKARTLVGQGVTLVKGALDAIGLAALTPDPPLTLEILLANNVSVRALIDSCRVPITNLYDAGIVTSFKDLQDLHFHPRDLLRKRELFQASALPQLFKTSFSGMRSQGCAFSLDDLTEQHFKPNGTRRERKAKFLSSELHALSVSLDTIIREDRVSMQQLIDINYSLDELEALGFEREHLQLLDITRKQALEPWPAGFGWSRKEYEALCKS